MGSVGDDEIAAEARRGLEGAGVDLTGLRIAAGEPTGLAMILVSERGDNQIVVVPGANRSLGADDFELADADGVLCQLEVPIEAVAAAAEQTRGMFCLNAAPARIVPEEVLARADLIVANSFELETLGSTPLGRALRADAGRRGSAPARGRKGDRARRPAGGARCGRHCSRGRVLRLPRCLASSRVVPGRRRSDARAPRARSQRAVPVRRAPSPRRLRSTPYSAPDGYFDPRSTATQATTTRWRSSSRSRAPSSSFSA